jgi:hypothetical protein
MRWTGRSASLVALLLAACATGSGGSSGSPTGSVITSRDLQGTNWNTALEVLRNNPQLRIVNENVFLRYRGPSTINSAIQDRGMLLVLDGTQITSNVVDVLRSIDSSRIKRIEILQPAQAASLYGTAAGSGVLVVQTLSRG